MRWYAARLLAEAVHPDNPQADALYEESIIVLRAGDEHEARRRAADIGRQGEHEYKNPFGQTVHWEFREVAEVKEVVDDKIVDGTEVYSRFMDRDEVERIVSFGSDKKRQASGSAR